MANLFKITFAFVLFVFVVPATTFAQDAAPAVSAPAKIHREYKPAVGKPHRDFVLPSIEDGKELQLSDYRGKKVLLLHFASW